MANSTVAVIHVWRDYNGPSDSPYSVSLCDSDGEEITCDGGDELGAAWERACELADEHGVPAEQIAESGEVVVVDTYTPDPATKDAVDSCSWETVACYVSTFPNGDEDGAADVEVQIGSAGVGQCERWCKGRSGGGVAVTRPAEHWFRAGHVERGPRYEWRDGYSLVTVNGRTTQPWSTKREAQRDAKLRGRIARFHESFEAALVATRKENL